MDGPLRIGVVAERRYLAQTQPSGMIAALRRASHAVTVIDPQEAAYRMGDDAWLDGLDVVVGRGRSCALLCLLGWAESRGIPTLNTRAAVGAVLDKAEMSVRFAAEGIPMPRTYFGTIPALAGSIPESEYPIILKPVFGDNSRGLVVAETVDEARAVEWSEPVALAQHYVPNDGLDLKLYGIGDDIWAVRKPSPFDPGPGTGRRAAGRDASAAELTPELVDLGRRCGRIFGLELYGVDCVETPDGPLVIEVNDFPNYTAVPQADERLADYVVAAAAQRTTR
jgi:ribosomal protein S6--L-glutamate ligase